MGVFQVTQRQWYLIKGNWPSHFTTNPDKRPVERVSWNDINESGGFIDAINSLTGLSFRLPTEAEWEYAAKAGTSTNYSYGNEADGAYMWYHDNSDIGNGYWETHEVGTKLPNPWGLYDMHGNVSEWCQDWFQSDYYASSPTNDPQGPPASGSSSFPTRVNRGGGLFSQAYYCRSAYRGYRNPVNRSFAGGFRVVCVSP